MSVVRELVTLWGFDIDQKPLKELDAGINTIKTSLQYIGIAAAASSAAIGYLLNKAGEDEQTKIAFETMLGSAELAEEKLKELKEFALKTPFELVGLKDATKRLLAYGFEADRLIPTLSALGDISAGVGQDKLPLLILALGQVRAAGKLTGMELRQFTENGVPMLEQLSKTLGKPVKEIQAMVSKGQIGFGDVEKALFSLTQEGGRFFNLMAKQSKSLLGLWSNFQDWVGMLAVDIGDGLLPVAKELMAEFLEWANINRDLIKTNLTEFVVNLSDMVFGLVNIIKALYKVMYPVVQLFGGWNNALDLMMLSFQGLMGLGLVYGIGLIAKSLYGLTTAWIAMGNAAMIAQIKVMAMPLAIGAIIVAIALLAEDLIAFAQGRDSVFGRMMNGIDMLFEHLRNKFGVFSQIGAFLINVLLMPLRMIMNGFKTMLVLLDLVRGKIGFKDAAKTLLSNLGDGIGITGEGVTGGLGAMGKVNAANAQYEAGNNPMVGLGGGVSDEKAKGKGGAGGSGTSVNTLNLNVEGLAPENQVELIKGTLAEELNTMFRQTMRDGESPVER